MSAEPQRTCPSCGNEFSGAMEFCPVCMLRQGLAGRVESGESSVSEDTVSSTPEQAVQRFEHYELVRGEDGKPVELGRGAMGVTYKALDVDLRCPVTLKVISERYLGDESARLRFFAKPVRRPAFGTRMLLRSSTSHIAEPYWFWTAWSRYKIRLGRKKDTCVTLPSKRFCAGLPPSLTDCA
jgi:hypothetical protein